MTLNEYKCVYVPNTIAACSLANNFFTHTYQKLPFLYISKSSWGTNGPKMKLLMSKSMNDTKHELWHQADSDYNCISGTQLGTTFVFRGALEICSHCHDRGRCWSSEQRPQMLLKILQFRDLPLPHPSAPCPSSKELRRANCQ